MRKCTELQGPPMGVPQAREFFHISVGSKPLRPECLKNDSLYLGQSGFLNNCSTFPSPHYSMYHFNFLQVIIWWISHARQALISPPSLREPQRLCISRGKKNQKCVQSTWNKFNSFEHISCSLLSPVASCWEMVHSVCRNHKPEIKRKMSLLWGHIPTKFSSIGFLCVALSEERPALCAFIV